MTDEFNLKCYDDNQLFELASMQELGIDSIIVQDLILLYYGQVDDMQKASIRNFIALKTSIIFIFEDELRKRNLLDEYREQMFLPDYRTSKKTYKSYAERIHDLCNMAFEGILSPRGVEAYYKRINEENLLKETEKKQEKSTDDEEKGPKEAPNNELLN